MYVMQNNACMIEESNVLSKIYAISVLQEDPNYKVFKF